MNSILATIGLADGQGNTSSTRVAMMLVVLAVLSPKIILAIQTKTVPEWTVSDMEMLGIVFGVKLVQNHQEKPVETK